jgi:predicted pyridoxine 5'-phosphate oxidase superfamily flavin-nucleotide-binding protein
MSRIDDLREKLGGAHPRAATKVKPYLEPLLQGFIANAPFLVMATSNEAGDCDASPKGGLPGFVRIVDDLSDIPPSVRGIHRGNPVNRPRRHGVQVELPPAVRGYGPDPLDEDEVIRFAATLGVAADAWLRALDARAQHR